MTHREVKQLSEELALLLNHLVTEKVDIFHLNYGLNKNFTQLTAAVKEIQKGISPELITLEGKIHETGKKWKGIAEKKPETIKKLKIVKKEDELPGIDEKLDESIMSAKDVLVQSDWIVGLAFSTKEEQARHKELIELYNKELESENDFVIYKLSEEKLDAAGFKLEFGWMQILSKFL